MATDNAESLIFYDWIQATDLEEAHKIETAGTSDLTPGKSRINHFPGYPPEEAASLATFQCVSSP